MDWSGTPQSDAEDQTEIDLSDVDLDYQQDSDDDSASEQSLPDFDINDLRRDGDEPATTFESFGDRDGVVKENHASGPTANDSVMQPRFGITTLPDELLCKIASFIDLDPSGGAGSTGADPSTDAQFLSKRHLLSLIVESRRVCSCFCKIGTEVLRLRLDILYIHPSWTSLEAFEKILASPIFASHITKIVVIGSRWDASCLTDHDQSTFAGYTRKALASSAAACLGHESNDVELS